MGRGGTSGQAGWGTVGQRDEQREKRGRAGCARTSVKAVRSSMGQSTVEEGQAARGGAGQDK